MKAYIVEQEGRGIWDRFNKPEYPIVRVTVGVTPAASPLLNMWFHQPKPQKCGAEIVGRLLYRDDKKIRVLTNTYDAFGRRVGQILRIKTEDISGAITLS